MADPIRDALKELVEAMHEQFFGADNSELSPRVIKATNEAYRLLVQQQAAPAAKPPADAPPPAPACDGEQNVHRELAQWLEQLRQPAPPPAPAPIDIDALLSPEGAYQRGTGHEDGAQLASGPNGPEWWAPLYGCETLDNLLDRLRARILPHLRPPIVGIDVPGPDGDYGDVMDLCTAEGVDPRVGVPLLKRAREAWAAALLRQPAPAVVPVPVAERPWEREGWCDADGRCWWSHGPTPTARWSLLPMDRMDAAPGWLLPHWAIPIPQQPLGGEATDA